MDPAEARGARATEAIRRVDAGAELLAHETLLRAGRPSWRVRVLDRPALSYGVGVPDDAPYVARARRAGLTTLRRTSGGTGVLHAPGDVLWARVLPRTDPTVGRDFSRAYARLGAAVAVGLTSLGVPADWRPAPAVAEAYCPLSSRGEVLATPAGIVGGAGQHATAGALLHQGFVAWRVDRAAVDRLFGLDPGGPSLRLGAIGDTASGLTPDRVAVAVADAFAAAAGG